jgi:hypothetical protein
MANVPGPPQVELRPPWTRDSTVRIDREGNFWHDGVRVDHPGLARAFARWLDRDPATGRYILRNAVDWCYIAVDDAPLVVRAIVPAPEGTLMLLLSDGSREPLDEPTLRVDADDVPYCDVRAGALPARFSPQAAFALLERVAPDGATLTLFGRSVPLRRVPRGCGARPPGGAS